MGDDSEDLMGHVNQ